jgi:hypothetical protein
MLTPWKSSLTVSRPVRTESATLNQVNPRIGGRNLDLNDDWRLNLCRLRPTGEADEGEGEQDSAHWIGSQRSIELANYVRPGGKRRINLYDSLTGCLGSQARDRLYRSPRLLLDSL